MKQQSEAQLQMATARYLDARGFLWCHVPNGEARNPITGAKLKRMGVKRGVPDVLIFHPFRTHSYNGLAIELKVGNGKQRPEQLSWMLRLRGKGWMSEVCRSVDDVIALVETCYGK